ncbi:hypothetical protein PAXRUDRAFT_831037 [Paxillus rubicundulus Ve08.2h10]|uniref:Uncharacterized protein n=1 Tax=Paxillus rubicundulus Ve08.2h10 TaxID=930991 RepID=A0A0D0DSM2_9AGAM|nr:hypothetical protein PAXRUDRAFT_831037 [Paxillus rubicundulus Ve08.2h10]
MFVGAATLLTPSSIVVMTGLEVDLGTLHKLPGDSGSLQTQPYPGPTRTPPMRWSFGPDVFGMLFFRVTRKEEFLISWTLFDPQLHTAGVTSALWNVYGIQNTWTAKYANS